MTTRTNRPLPQPLYVAAVGALAVFFAIQLMWPNPPVRYRARRTLNATVVNNDHRVDIAALAESDATNSRYWSKLLATDAESKISTEGIRVKAHGAGSRFWFDITVTGDDDHQVELVADKLSAGLAEWQPSTEAPQGDQTSASWEIREAAHYYRKANSDLDNFLTGLLQTAQVDRPMNATELADSEPELNPDWTRLQERLEQQQRQLDAMLESLTTEHPQVRQLRHTIQANQAELASTPRFPGETAASASTSIASRFSALSAGEVAQAARQYSELQQTAAAARQRYDDLLLAQSDAEATRPTPVVSWSWQRSGSTELLTQRATAIRFLLPAFLAALGGSLLAVWAWSLLPLSRFQESGQVTAELGVPVLADLSDLSAESTEKSDRLQKRCRIIRSATLACEIALAAALLLCVFRAVSVSPYFERFSHSPFATFSETVGSYGTRG